MKTKITALLLVAGALTTAAYAGTALNPSSSAGPAGLSSSATDQPKTDSSQQSTVKQLILSDSRFSYSYKGSDGGTPKEGPAVVPNDENFQAESVGSRVRIGVNPNSFVSSGNMELTTCYPSVTLHFDF